MFDYNLIDEYQIEITSYCNAACPQCPRNNLGTGINPRIPLTHLDRSVIDRAFNAATCMRLRQVFFCGSYGDPIMHPDFLDILKDFRRKNPTLWLYMHTNGGVHDTDYWTSIAEIMAGYGQIDFGIDGLEDTLSLYRQNVDFNHVMANARAFISAGGRAQWNFIVFQHNEHQVEQARQMSKEFGFHDILVRHTGRFFNHRTLEEMPAWPVNSRDGQTRYLRPPTQPEYKNRSMKFLPDLKREFPNIKDYFDTTPIRCDALMGKKVAINVQGLVLPCNFFNHNLYDMRFYESVLPECNELSVKDGKNQVRGFLESYGLENLDIHHRNLEEIFQCSMWDDLVKSWNQTLNQGRIFECAMTCGKKLTKVWDQGGSKR